MVPDLRNEENLRQLLVQVLETSLLGARFGRHGEAEQMIGAVRAFRPEKRGPLIALALTKLYANDPREAIAILSNDVLTRDPDDAVAKTFLSLALKLGGLDDESRRVLTEVESTSEDSKVVRLARAITDVLDKLGEPTTVQP